MKQTFNHRVLYHFPAPSAVPPFEVFSIGTTHATLLWEPVPLSKRNGVILYYQIVLHRQNGTQLVYNVSASPQNEKKIFKLQNLSPGQEYEVRIRAVTAAGPGENATIKFETDPRQVSGISSSHLNYFFVEYDEMFDMFLIIFLAK